MSVTHGEAVCLYVLIKILSTKGHSSLEDKNRNTLVEVVVWEVEIQGAVLLFLSVNH